MHKAGLLILLFYSKPEHKNILLPKGIHSLLKIHFSVSVFFWKANMQDIHVNNDKHVVDNIR